MNDHRNTMFRIPRGSAMLDLIVAAVLVSALITTVTTITVRTTRLLKEARHQQLALDELSNHIETLVAQQDADLTSALASLKLSEPLLNAAPAATLASQVIEDVNGKRIVLELAWNSFPTSAPLQLVGWIDPPTTQPTTTREAAQ